MTEDDDFISKDDKDDFTPRPQSPDLEQQLVNLRWESLLKNRQKTVRLSTNCHSQGQMFNTICNVTCCQKFFSQLNFLQEESLNGLLITKVWQLRSRIASS